MGDETATGGTAYIDEQNIARRLRSIRRLGYCPQENCSMDFLTVRDGLYLLARIRGVNFGDVHGMVQTISSLFLLDPFLNNYIHQLSGGTKRRLHAALALIGKKMVRLNDWIFANVSRTTTGCYSRRTNNRRGSHCSTTNAGNICQCCESEINPYSNQSFDG